MHEESTEVLTFRDKFGTILMSLGVGCLIIVALSILSLLGTGLVLLMSPFLDGPFRELVVYRLVLALRFTLLLAVAGVALIKLSTYTVKK